MASFLRLNGIAMPVSVNTPPSLETEFIGKNTRALDGSLVSTRRAVKESWKFTTAIKTAAEALAFRDLVIGKGHVLSFDAQHGYTSKGMAPVSMAGGWSFTTTGPKYGAACASWTTGNAVWAFFPTTGPWTLCYWLNVSGGGYHHVIQSSSGVLAFDGVTGGYSLPPGWGSINEGFGGVSSGSATFGSSTASKIDDIVALPYLIPTDWCAQIYGFGQAFGLLPALTADGDAVEQNLGTISVLGSEPSGKLYRGATAKNLHDFTFELHQR